MGVEAHCGACPLAAELLDELTAVEVPRVPAAARIREALAAEDPCAVAVLRAVFAVHQLWFNAAHRPSRLAPSWRARA
jgi:hypothetical protein